VRDFDFWEKVSAIRAQTLVLTGTHDSAAPPSEAQKLAKQIPGARYTELPAAHISNVEAASLFTDEVSSFLQS
jgi:3-oxoadipate enol-lactonase